MPAFVYCASREHVALCKIASSKAFSVSHKLSVTSKIMCTVYW